LAVKARPRKQADRAEPVRKEESSMRNRLLVVVVLALMVVGSLGLATPAPALAASDTGTSYTPADGCWYGYHGCYTYPRFYHPTYYYYPTYYYNYYPTCYPRYFYNYPMYYHPVYGYPCYGHC